jgi:hypothetical protein
MAAALALTVGVAPVGAQTTERIVSDRHTGLAIGGFDPVAYFIDGEALVGRGTQEFRHGGVVWRFRNPGNRAVFMQTPDLYMPVHGGYDPTAVARGTAVPGNPTLWVIAAGRLYLFYTVEARDQFLAAPDKAIAAAEAQWPQVMDRLVP